MPFDLTHWRAEVRALVAAIARDPRGAMARAGVSSLYGLLLGSAILPVAAAAASDPGAAAPRCIRAPPPLGAYPRAGRRADTLVLDQERAGYRLLPLDGGGSRAPARSR